MLAPRYSPIALKARTLHRIVDGAGLTILCLKGAIWVTQQNDRCDTVLRAGETFTLDRPGLAVLYALNSACATILSRKEPPPAERAALPGRADAST
jgi:hypothetical protein